MWMARMWCCMVRVTWRPSEAPSTKARVRARKAIRSLTLLDIWEIWSERNSRFFGLCESSLISLVAKIKKEA
ncbi:hypothetical protein SETIT_6G071900v2 [Setaria italica]|uniref:Uncharacterized protein n=1 Tax=Setaria italica TaxID=4555 RepID=A0A368RJC6_SETIT|nr:hypothetical protein SETIT_6G071900v2 [Setaria italica]